MATSESDEDLLSDHAPLVYDSQPNAQVDPLAYADISSYDESEDGPPNPAKFLATHPETKNKSKENVNASLNPLILSADTPRDALERPNKFHGPASTWRGWTEPERLLASSLTQLRNQDLALHLRAAHHLKRRLRDPTQTRQAQEWHSKVRWQDPAKSVNGQGFDPGKRWTAWPQPPEGVPREWERWGKPADEVKSSAERLFNVPSRVILEDELIALVLKLAKERFNARDFESEDEVEVPRTQVKAEPGHSPEPKAESAPRKKDPAPVVLADDDKARDILRAPLQHVLAQLDSILMDLHHSRAAYTTSKVASSCSTSRSRSVSRSRRQSTPIASKVPKEKTPQAPTVAEPVGPRKPRTPGRPRTFTERLKGESYYQMRKRLAGGAGVQNATQSPQTLQKATSASPSPSPTRKVPRRRPSSTSLRPGTRNSRNERTARLHPRDWTDILSAAAQTGIKKNILLRTAERCALLFGEGMLFRTLRSDGTEEEVFVGEHPGWDKRRSLVGESGSENDNDDDEDEEKGEDEDDEDDEKNQRGRSMLWRPTVVPGEQIEGGIRKDGFMEPIPPPRMRRGADLGKRKPKTGLGSGEDGVDVDGRMAID